MQTIVDLRNDDERGERAEVPDGVEVVHVPLDRLDEDPEFWDNWMHGPQFATPLYYAPFLERFPHSLDEALDAIESARPGGVVFHCVGGRDRTGLVAIAVLAAAGVEPRRSRRLRAGPSVRTPTTASRNFASADSAALVSELATGTADDGPAPLAGVLSSELQR